MRPGRHGCQGRIPISELADIMAPVVSAVGAAHAHGIIHRDLKPDNIFLHRQLDGTDIVKVLDFGVAKVTEVDEDLGAEAGLTRTGAVLGTPMYMSPEQVFGETDLDHRADVWAVGIILYQCLSGVLPTAGANPGQVFKIIVAGKIKPIRAVSTNVPDDLAELIDATLSRKRTERPNDLRPVLDVLHRYSERRVQPFGPPRLAWAAHSGDLEPPSTYDSTAEGQDTAELSAVSGGPATVEDRGRAWLLVVGGLAAVLVLAAVVWFASGLPTRSPPVVGTRSRVHQAASGQAVPMAPRSALATTADSAAGLPGAPGRFTSERFPRRGPRRPASPHPEDPYGF